MNRTQTWLWVSYMCDKLMIIFIITQSGAELPTSNPTSHHTRAVDCQPTAVYAVSQNCYDWYNTWYDSRIHLPRPSEVLEPPGGARPCSCSVPGCLPANKSVKACPARFPGIWHERRGVSLSNASWKLKLPRWTSSHPPPRHAPTASLTPTLFPTTPTEDYTAQWSRPLF